eukprot:633069-Amphidinium_carterae.1
MKRSVSLQEVTSVGPNRPLGPKTARMWETLRLHMLVSTCCCICNAEDNDLCALRWGVAVLWVQQHAQSSTHA